MKSLKFSILTPERKVLEREVSQVSLPTMEGEITVLPDHLPLVGLMRPGTIHLKHDDHEEVLSVAGGFFKVSGDEVRILADSAERAEELDLKIIEEAHRRAEEALLAARNEEDVNYSGLAANLERELARLKTFKKHHSKIHPPNLE